MTEENNDALPAEGSDAPEGEELGPILPVDESNPEMLEEIRNILGDSYEGDPEAIQLISRVVASYYQGPLPSPSMLRGYNEVVPGAANRILTLMEQQSAHRQELERTTVDANIRNRDRGQIFAFILCLIVTVGGLLAIFLGQSLAGFATILVAVGGIAATFLATRQREQRELEEKRAVLPEEGEQGNGS